MYVLTTNTSEWINGSATEIRFEFEEDAKAEAEKWSGPGENMIERCAWRLLYERWDDVQGDSVTFRVAKDDILGLIDRIRVANSEVLN